VEEVNRYEKTIRVPSVTITKRLAQIIEDELHTLAETRVDHELAEFLRASYTAQPQLAQGAIPQIGNVEAFVQANIQNPAYRQTVRSRAAENYTFLAGSGNIKIVGNEFEFEQIPLDTNGVIARADGPQGEFISIAIKAQFRNYNDLIDPANNLIVIQGPAQNWVDGVYERLRNAIEAERNPVRNVVYRASVLWTWVTFGLLIFLEYLLTKKVVSNFNLQVPLTGLSSLLVFGVLFANVILVANLFIRVAGYFYPYFEFTDNLSRPRTFWRRLFIVTVLAAYSGSIGLLIRILFKR
jgi:hypothetical protein